MLNIDLYFIDSVLYLIINNHRTQCLVHGNMIYRDFRKIRGGIILSNSRDRIT